MKKYFLLLSILFFIASSFCYSQFKLNVLNNQNKPIREYREGDDISLYLNEKKLSNDTTINTLLRGSITEITSDSIKINYVYQQKDYFYKNKKLNFYTTFDAIEDYDLKYNIPLKDICVINHESKIKNFGYALSAIGIAAIVISPIFSMNFGNLDDFNTNKYLMCAGFGLGLGVVGITLTFSTKDKHIIINKKILGIDQEKRVKIFNGKINVDKDIY